jgi:prepilin-type processing-associated H-X9-DG protein
MWYEGPSDNDLYLPTIHFRHLERANVIWCDGHANAQEMSFTRGDYGEFNLGWFGPRSNELFDPF